MSTLASTQAPLPASASRSSTGESCLHGPHQVAHRSTTTGTVIDRSSTSVWKLASVTSMTNRRHRRRRRRPGAVCWRAAASERAFSAARSTAPAMADDSAAVGAAGRELGRDTPPSWHASTRTRAAPRPPPYDAVPSGPSVRVERPRADPVRRRPAAAIGSTGGRRRRPRAAPGRRPADQPGRAGRRRPRPTAVGQRSGPLALRAPSAAPAASERPAAGSPVVVDPPIRRSTQPERPAR